MPGLMCKWDNTEAEVACCLPNCSTELQCAGGCCKVCNCSLVHCDTCALKIFMKVICIPCVCPKKCENCQLCKPECECCNAPKERIIERIVFREPPPQQNML